MQVLIVAYNILYALCKLFPVKPHRVLFLSRQGNAKSLDFVLIEEELQRRDPSIQCVFLCRRFTGDERSPVALLLYVAFLVKTCWYLARSRVAVLDSYSVPVSVLKHRKYLYVIQIWHAMGKIKKSGYAGIGRPGGRKETLAQSLHMHENYSIIVAGGYGWNRYYEESFRVGSDKLCNIGLPRVDYLRHNQREIRQKLLQKHPEFNDKKLLLYAPTFRKSAFDAHRQLMEVVDDEQSILVVRPHWRQEIAPRLDIKDDYDDFSTLELLAACDYLITDYSAIAVEAAALDKKTLYYCFDYQHYQKNVGLNIDLFEEMPGCVFADAAELMRMINTDAYPYESLAHYQKKYLPEDCDNAIRKNADLIMDEILAGAQNQRHGSFLKSTLHRAERRVLKFARLCLLYLSRIVFVRNHHKATFRQKVQANLSGGFLADQWVLYDLDHHDRRQYLSEFDWYRSRYINSPFNFMLNNKVISDELLRHYVQTPKIILVKSRNRMMSYEEGVKDTASLCDILVERRALYCKPISAGKGKGVYRLGFEDGSFYIDSDQCSRAELESFLDEQNNWFATECAEQSDYLSSLYDKTTNTIRFIVFKDRATQVFQLFFAVQRIGTSATIPVDNGSRGGLVAKIDLETGSLSYAQTLHSLKTHKTHPDTGSPIEGIVIPNWNHIKEEMIELSNHFPWLNFIAWDILLTKEGICIIEANTSSGVNIVQLWGGQREGALGDFYRSNNILRTKTGEAI